MKTILNHFCRGGWLLAACLAFAAAQPAAAQNRTVTLPTSRMEIRDVLREIESQTGYLFAIGHSNFDMTRTVAMSHRQGAVSDILDEALEGTGRNFHMDGDQILLIPVQLPPEEQKTMVIRRFDWSLSYGNEQFMTDASQDSLRRTALESIRNNRPADTPEAEVTVIVDSVFRLSSKTLSWGDLSEQEWKRASADTPNHFLLKTNLLHIGLGQAISLSGEIGTGRQTSVDLSWGWNGWNRDGSYDDNKKLIHWFLRPEFRYWTCERFDGHFFGLHAFYWQYNVSGHKVPMLFKKQYQYEGNAFGAGVSYGYHWAWSRHWGMEFNVGVGVAFMNYDKFECEKCSDKQGNFDKTYFGPTSLGIKLVYLIK